MVVKKDICIKLSDKEIIEKSLEDLNHFACINCGGNGNGGRVYLIRFPNN